MYQPLTILSFDALYCVRIGVPRRQLSRAHATAWTDPVLSTVPRQDRLLQVAADWPKPHSSLAQVGSEGMI